MAERKVDGNLDAENGTVVNIRVTRGKGGHRLSHAFQYEPI